MSEEQENIRIIRNYDIPVDLYNWLQVIAKRERRPVIKQVEVIFDNARMMDKARIEREEIRRTQTGG